MKKILQFGIITLFIYSPVASTFAFGADIKTSILSCDALQSSGDIRAFSKSASILTIQSILNLDPSTQVSSTGPGSKGQETNNYGNATYSAIKRFQEKYKNEILIPVGLTNGNGFVGPATRKKLIELCQLAHGATSDQSKAPQTTSTNIQEYDTTTSSSSKSMSTPTNPSISKIKNKTKSNKKETIPNASSTIVKTLLNTRPKESDIRLITPLCKPTKASVAKGVYGLSDPRLSEKYVQNIITDIAPKWVRAEFRWDWISPKKDVFYQIEDKNVTFFRDNTINVLGTVGYPPTYITDWKVFGRDYAVFFNNLINRYKPNGSFAKESGYTGDYGVHYWEIFNEPNSPGFGWFDGRTNSVYKGDDFLLPYVYTLVLSNIIARESDPNAVLVFGGLSPDGVPATDFLKKVYELGAKDCFDVIAFHPYAYENRFAEARKNIEAISSAYGDGSKPIWFDEYGTPTDSRRTVMLNDTMKERNIPDALFWYTFIDYFDNKEGSWEVVKMNGTKKPEYNLLKNLIK